MGKFAGKDVMKAWFWSLFNGALVGNFLPGRAEQGEKPILIKDIYSRFNLAWLTGGQDWLVFPPEAEYGRSVNFPYKPSPV